MEEEYETQTISEKEIAFEATNAANQADARRMKANDD